MPERAARLVLAFLVSVPSLGEAAFWGGSVFSECRSASTVIGLPLEAQAFYRPGKRLGIGLYGFANLNRRQSLGGVTLGVQAGRLR